MELSNHMDFLMACGLMRHGCLCSFVYQKSLSNLFFLLLVIVVEKQLNMEMLDLARRSVPNPKARSY